MDGKRRCCLNMCALFLLLELAVFSLAGFSQSQQIIMWKVCFAAGGLAVEHQNIREAFLQMAGCFEFRGSALGHHQGLVLGCWPVTHGASYAAVLPDKPPATVLGPRLSTGLFEPSAKK